MIVAFKLVCSGSGYWWANAVADGVFSALRRRLTHHDVCFLLAVAYICTYLVYHGRVDVSP